MLDLIVRNETHARLVFFVGILIIICLWELIAPKRKLNYNKMTRWYSNLGLTFTNTILARIVFPLTAVEFALLVQSKNWGLFNFFNTSLPFSIVLSVIILDLVIYLQHVVFHFVPVLWRLHRMHHADLDFDVTTGSRFHPIEILLSMGIKFVAILLLGAPGIAVIIFEVILNGVAMFNHGNIRLYPSIEKALRLFIVTPDMHRVHHSMNPNETNSNFGFNLSCWDKIFKTYRHSPIVLHEEMTIGLPLFRNPKFLHYFWLLVLPFIKKNKNASNAPK